MKKEFKGCKGAGTIIITIPVKELKKVPNYFMIDLDLLKVKKREKGE